MVITRFPPIETADKTGLLAAGGDLDIESLLLAYRSGIFPWPVDDDILAWFCPPKRTVLFLDKFHISRSLGREIKRNRYSFAFNRDFKSVIKECSISKNRGNQKGTWITDEIIRAYIKFHSEGYAHSIECYNGEKLAGGLYGVSIGGMFAGESMFYLEPDTSKLSLHFLTEYLKTKKIEWIDCQVMTPHLKSLGAEEIPRDQFLEMLKNALKRKVTLFD